MNKHKEGEVDSGDMLELLREIRNNYIGYSKAQTDQEASWCRRIDAILGKEPCGLFIFDFDSIDNIRITPTTRTQKPVRVEMDFSSHEEAEIAIEQLMALLRAVDILNNIANTPVEESYSQHTRFMNFVAKLQDLRHGKVSI